MVTCASPLHVHNSENGVPLHNKSKDGPTAGGSKAMNLYFSFIRYSRIYPSLSANRFRNFVISPPCLHAVLFNSLVVPPIVVLIGYHLQVLGLVHLGGNRHTIHLLEVYQFFQCELRTFWASHLVDERVLRKQEKSGKHIA